MLEPWAETGFFWSSESDRRGVMLLVRMVASSFRCVDRAFQHSELAEFVRGPPRLLSSPFGLVTAFVWKVVQRGVTKMKMDRREFLRKAGLGSIALASLPKIVDSLATPAAAQGQRWYSFVVVNKGKTVGGVDHRLVMTGAGLFDAQAGTVDGGGNFLHFDNAPPGTPKPILGVGRWRPKKILNYEKLIGSFGRIAAGALVLSVDLLPDLGPVRRIEGATLRIVCNIGPAGLSTGEPEGVVLTIPGADFSPFVPQDPVAGLTHLSVPAGF